MEITPLTTITYRLTDKKGLMLVNTEFIPESSEITYVSIWDMLHAIALLSIDPHKRVTARSYQLLGTMRISISETLNFTYELRTLAYIER